MKAAAWIDRVKAVKGWESVFRVAKLLGFKGNTISMYRSHGGPMDENIALKVANSLAIDPAIVLVDQALERAKTDTSRSAWSAVLERLGGVAVSILLLAGIGGAGLGSSDARASGAMKSAALEDQHSIHRMK